MTATEFYNNTQQSDSESFYGGKKEGLKLIDPINFPKEIVDFLNESVPLLDYLINEKHYSDLIEAGCMNKGWFLDACVKSGIRYFGIDKDCKLVDELRSKIDKQKRKHVNLICHDASNIHALAEKHTIVNGILVFPFNSFGNLWHYDLKEDLAEPTVISASASSLDIAVFTYGTDQVSTIVRQTYYTNCKYHGLQFRDDNKGILFESNEGLHSYAYSEYFMTRLFSDNGYDVEIKEFAKVGRLYIGKKSPR